jgi:hypothetical protein
LQSQGYKEVISFEKFCLEKSAPRALCWHRDAYRSLALHLAIQALRSLCSHGPRRFGYCLSWYQTDLGCHSCDAGFAGMQNAKINVVMEASIQISKEGLGGQAMCGRM